MDKAPIIKVPTGNPGKWQAGWLQSRLVLYKQPSPGRPIVDGTWQRSKFASRATAILASFENMRFEEILETATEENLIINLNTGLGPKGRRPRKCGGSKRISSPFKTRHWSPARSHIENLGTAELLRKSLEDLNETSGGLGTDITPPSVTAGPPRFCLC